MNRLRILMIRLNNVTRGVLSRGLPTWREKVSLCVIALATPIVIALLNPLRKLDAGEAERSAGWVTNCSGPEFAKFSQTNSAGPGGTSRPVFRISDQLVLAVPKINRPYVGDIERFPRECRTIADLPKAPYLYFVIRGNWSGNYDPGDVPLQDGKKQFLPDAVIVRVEEAPMSVDARRELEQYLEKPWNKDLRDKQEIGGLTCGRSRYDRNRGMGGLLCSGPRFPSDPDMTRFTTQAFDMTPFYHLDANYESPHYGGIRVYWNVWTMDVAHGREIDQAIWNSLAEWNLMREPATQPRQQ